MQLIPSFRASLLSGGLFLFAYFLGLVTHVLLFPPDKRRKLFSEPTYNKKDRRRWIIVLGRMAAITLVVIMFFSPLKLETIFFLIGLGIYLVGYALVMVSLVHYRRAPTDRMVTNGLYRVSRNPQWLGLVLVFTGTSVAVAGWLHVVLLALFVTAYHFQILLEEKICLRLYGEEYRAYMRAVPRYILFL